MTPYIAEEILPGKTRQSDEEIVEFFRQNGRSNHHTASSCKMGIDDQAVVDPRLCVRGVGKLRIMDASVMPNVVGGNTLAAVVMIAEKGVAMILEDETSGR